MNIQAISIIESVLLFKHPAQPKGKKTLLWKTAKKDERVSLFLKLDIIKEALEWDKEIVELEDVDQLLLAWENKAMSHLWFERDSVL